jgi:hypothetical protein
MLRNFYNGRNQGEHQLAPVVRPCSTCLPDPLQCLYTLWLTVRFSCSWRAPSCQSIHILRDQTGLPSYALLDRNGQVLTRVKLIGVQSTAVVRAGRTWALNATASGSRSPDATRIHNTQTQFSRYLAYIRLQRGFSGTPRLHSVVSHAFPDRVII